MNRLAALAPLAVLIVLVAIFAGFALRHDPTVTPMALVGKPTPGVELAPLGGGAPRPLRAAAGRGPVLINFFASWCAPCAQEAPALKALQDEGVRIIAIDYKDTPADAAAFLARFGDPYQAVFADPTGRAGIEFGVTGVPETYAVDARGVIRAKRALPLTAADAEGLLEAATR